CEGSGEGPLHNGLFEICDLQSKICNRETRQAASLHIEWLDHVSTWVMLPAGLRAVYGKPVALLFASVHRYRLVSSQFQGRYNARSCPSRDARAERVRPGKAAADWETTLVPENTRTVRTRRACGATPLATSSPRLAMADGYLRRP